MSDRDPDDGDRGDRGDRGDHGDRDPDDRRPAARPVEDEVGAAVDDALSDELKRQRARFVQAYIGVDRAEGVGRGEAHWNESLRREAGGETPGE